MTTAGRSARSPRLLVLAPTGKDAALTQSILARASVPCDCFGDLDELCSEVNADAGAVLIPEEAMTDARRGVLADWVARQPSWSDLPVMILARPGADSSAVAEAMERLGNVTVLERPMRVAALVSAARTALRARQRQFQIRDQMARRERTETELRVNDRRKDEFLAVLAHELRNPLAPIRYSLHVLREASRHDPKAEAVGEMMDRQVDYMVRLVDDLLEVSRITRGKIELRKERIEIAAVIRSAIETSGPLIDAAGHRLVLEAAPEPLYVDGDPVRLAQVLANLLNNAAKFTDSKGEIRLTVRREGGWGSISVRDSGVGIPPHLLSSVFELFTQLDRQGARMRGGLGIGLTLVKSLIEMHSGIVEAHSAGRGRGSEFVVRLPLAAPPPPRPAPPAAERADEVMPRRVLVVDDNRDAADCLGIMLRTMGTDAHVAYGGAEALSALPTYDPDVVLLDVGMPDIDGLEVARRIRNRAEYRDLTLIALTGWGQDEDRRRSREAGFDHHLVKPADPMALRDLLHSVGGKARRRAGRRR